MATDNSSPLENQKSNSRLGGILRNAYQRGLSSPVVIVAVIIFVALVAMLPFTLHTTAKHLTRAATHPTTAKSVSSSSTTAPSTTTTAPATTTTVPTTTTTTTPTTTTPATPVPGAPSTPSCDAGPGGSPIEPSTIFIGCATSNTYLSDIQWTYWGLLTATATATIDINQCVPNCAMGKYTSYPVSVVLSDPGHMTMNGVPTGPLVFLGMLMSPTTSSRSYLFVTGLYLFVTDAPATVSPSGTPVSPSCNPSAATAVAAMSCPLLTDWGYAP